MEASLLLKVMRSNHFTTRASVLIHLNTWRLPSRELVYTALCINHAVTGHHKLYIVSPCLRSRSNNGAFTFQRSIELLNESAMLNPTLQH